MLEIPELLRAVYSDDSHWICILAPLVGSALLIIYLVAPHLLPFKNNRNAEDRPYTYKSKKNASQTREEELPRIQRRRTSPETKTGRTGKTESGHRAEITRRTRKS